MREDMAKVIVERPRYGSRWGKAKEKLHRQHEVPLEDLPTKEGMHHRWRNMRKALNENLAPLRRFLRSHVGQPWDAVNSEIRERINLDSAVQLHIWQHVQQYVCTKPMQIDGKLFNERGYPLRGGFYVEPETGILRELKWSWKQKTKSPKPYIVINRHTQCRKLNGLWFVIHLKPLPADLLGVWDAVFKNYCPQIGARALYDYYGRSAYAVSKRQLSKKEIQKLKLS